CSTHPLDLLKVQMQLQGDTHAPQSAANPFVQSLRASLAFQTTLPGIIPVPPPQRSSVSRIGLIGAEIQIVQQDSVFATALR
ncbi:hypothetical protein U1Q18_004351, partial [Sarracenia purpurea var. burkii]